VRRAFAAAVACALAACTGSEPGVGSRVDLAFPPVVDLAIVCPSPLFAFAPQWNPPAGAYTGACSSAEIDRMVSMVAQEGATGLANFGAPPTSMACSVCLGTFAKVTTGASSAFVIRPTNVLDGNVGGCVALLEGRSDVGSCGAAVQAAADCGAQACQTCPMVAVSSQLAAYDQCLAGVAQGECAPFTGAAGCIDQVPAAAKCRSSAWTSSLDWVRFMAELFCGTPGDM
jgi:hypothetical protein